MHAGLLGAVYAAIKCARLFDAMADDAAVTVRAMRGQPMDRTFEAVERVSFAVHHNLEALVVVVSAVRTNAHSTTLRSHSAKEDRNKSGGVYLQSGRPLRRQNRIAARCGPYENRLLMIVSCISQARVMQIGYAINVAVVLGTGHVHDGYRPD